MKWEAYMNRMKMTATLFIIALTLLLVGCKPIAVLNPLFSESELLFEPQLLGDWAKIDKDGEGFCNFHDFDPQTKRYSVAFDFQNESGWLGKINDDYYLDIVSVEPNALPNKGLGELGIIQTAQGYVVEPSVIPISEQLYLDFRTDQSSFLVNGQSEKIKFKIQPLHKIYRLRLENNQLTVWYLDDEKLGSQIEKGMIRLAHQKEPFALITAETLELQEFLRAYGKSGELFVELGTYRRVVNQQLGVQRQQ
jgi:hypothetical protein